MSALHCLQILNDCEDCAICLNPLDNFDPTIVTRCKVRYLSRLCVRLLTVYLI